MIPFVSIVSSMLIDDLNRVRNTACMAMHGEKTRVELYKTVSLALLTLGAGAIRLAVAVSANILSDIKVPVLPQMLSQATEQEQSKKRGRSATSGSGNKEQAPVLASASSRADARITDPIRIAAAESTLSF
jgi:hypothetical protein